MGRDADSAGAAKAGLKLTQQRVLSYDIRPTHTHYIDPLYNSNINQEIHYQLYDMGFTHEEAILQTTAPHSPGAAPHTDMQ